MRLGAKRRNEAGFTVVELLVSLALLAMAAAMLTSGIAVAAAIIRRGEARTAAAEQVAAAQGLLRNRIELLVGETRFDAAAPYVDVQGEPDTFSFTAGALAAAPFLGQRRYRLRLDADGTLNLYTVDLLETRVDPRSPALDGWESTPLLDGARELEIGYFGVAPPDNRRRWRSEWLNRPRSPELIRIRVGLPDGDKRAWPELVVRPASRVGTACRLDALTGRCVQGA